MVRNYKKKRPKEKEINEDDMTNAVLQVVTGRMKLTEAASAHNVRANTLFYRVKRYKENFKPKTEDFTSKHTVAQVFDKDEERMLVGYFIKSSKMHYGLPYKQARVLAYEYATALKKCPPKWTENKEAGIDWLKGFMKRHKELSLRKPENTSLSRSTSFNKHNVTQFYDNYENVLKKHKFTPDRIYNLDETNIMTVVQAPNVIAKTGAKQVGQAVSAERGQLITMCGIVNAIGNTLPPVFIFPRARFHDSMLHGAPAGSVGFANSPTSGWMTGPLFLKVLEHIKKLVRCTTADPVLILMDNHESHCTLDAIRYCRQNGIILVSFPPHCTHKMQPLDVAVNGPFKQKLAVAQNDWLLNHPGKTNTIHDLCGIVTPTYNLTYVARNILSGFAKPGIFPFSRNAFSDEDFECAEVTNRPCPETNETSASEQPIPSVSPPSISAMDSSSKTIQAQPAAQSTVTNTESSLAPPSQTALALAVVDCDDNSLDHPVSPSVLDTPEYPINIPDSPVGQISTIPQAAVTPEIIRPFPKAPPRKESGRGRKKGRSRILTDTPEKNEIEVAYLQRVARTRGKKPTLKRTKTTIEKKDKKSSKRRTKKTNLFEESDDTDTEMHLDSEEEPSTNFLDTDKSDNEDVELNDAEGSAPVKVGDFVLVQFPTVKNQNNLNFVGKVEEIDGSGLTVNFFKKKGLVSPKFYYPEKEDKSYVSITDVLVKLPRPDVAPGTSRTMSMFAFKFDFSNFKLG